MKTTLMKFITIVAVATIGMCAYAHHPGSHRPYGPRAHYSYYPRHHHYSGWGHNGRYFWPGFAGAAVGTVIANTILPPPPPPPVVVSPQPVVVNPAPVVVAPRPVVIPPRPVIVW